MRSIASLILAIGILFVGGWQPIWKAKPTSVVQLALQDSLIKDKDMTNVENLLANPDLRGNQAAAELIGKYFLSEHGFGILVNADYYGADITNRFFESVILAWICMLLALSVCGLNFIVIW